MCWWESERERRRPNERVDSCQSRVSGDRQLDALAGEKYTTIKEQASARETTLQLQY